MTFLFKLFLSAFRLSIASRSVRHVAGEPIPDATAVSLDPGRISSGASACPSDPKLRKTLGERSVVTENCEGCRRSGTNSLEYTDLPEFPGLRPQFDANELRIVKKKIPLLHNSSIRLARLLVPSKCFLGVGRRHLKCRNAGSCLFWSVPGCFSVSRKFICRLVCPGCELLPDIEATHFLRAMEEENLTSPFFGIHALKRLSWLSASTLSRSRETFNAHQGPLVKRQVPQNFDNRPPDP